jgi:hypothetical protein
MPIEHVDAEYNIEERWSECQHESSDEELRTDAGAFPVPLPVDIDLYTGTEEHEGKHHGQEENDRGDSPNYDRFAAIGGSVLNAERSLPDQ